MGRIGHISWRVWRLGLRRQTSLNGGPVDGFEERVEVAWAVELVVGHEGMFEDVHDEERDGAGGMVGFMLVDPHVDQAAGSWVVVEDDPADAAHAAGGHEVIFPVVEGAEFAEDGVVEGAVGAEGRFTAHVAEIEFVEAHAVEFPAEAAFELGERWGGLLAGFKHGALLCEEEIDVIDVALIELEVVGEQGGAKAGSAYEMAEIDSRVLSGCGGWRGRGCRRGWLGAGTTGEKESACSADRC